MESLSIDAEVQLFAAIAAGDKQAFTVFMQQYIQSVTGFAYRMLADKSAAEDITQEAFTRVWQHAKNWRQQGASPKSWLFRITYNLAIDHLRKTGSIDEYIDSADVRATVDVLQEVDERHRYLLNAIGQLPERQKTALMLCAYHGMSNKEAAGVLEVSIDALESLLSRARRELRSKLIAAGVFP